MKTRCILSARKFLITTLLGLSSFSLAFAQDSAEPQSFDILIKNGKILDGTGNPWYSADLGIRGDRIVAIGKFSNASSKKTIDAVGKIVAPGFIDTLGQSEMAL